ncbi:MAG: ABC transporter [Acidiphilium sp. 37-64-53]|uniref:ABC transporter permease n=1 Tax=Acidiphilium TaxID=522 RepID=UPI000BC38063|nr:MULTISPECIES: ABC transporter permease [Acidiphilium]OYW04024.1 MAG: ABC transporter [Acidiphilium sp. 37-64-53]OZB29050.1 MAG: ABC transporter [Acidiphilium sp. 34-64-41]HQT83252.1 ABC transporter permease [Acidiphilium rubrum]
MKASLRRIWGLVYRHLCLYRRSWPRIVELAYWPTLELLIWGFTAQFVVHGQASVALKAGGALIGGVLLWEVALRAQMGVTISFLEEIWSRNLGHIFVSPLRPSELVAALLCASVMRTMIGLAPGALLAVFLYAFNIFSLGLPLLLLLLNLMLMGWWMSLGVIALLFRYGASAEALAWTLAFGITPLACVFYPVAVLPGWLRPIAKIIPAEHIFSAMREILYINQINWAQFLWALGLNGIWMLAAIGIFSLQFRAARTSGALISIGE